MLSHSTIDHISFLLIPYVLMALFSSYLMAVFSRNSFSWQFSHSMSDHGIFLIPYVIIADFSIFDHGILSHSIFSHGIPFSDIIAAFSFYIF